MTDTRTLREIYDNHRLLSLLNTRDDAREIHIAECVRDLVSQINDELGVTRSDLIWSIDPEDIHATLLKSSLKEGHKVLCIVKGGLRRNSPFTYAVVLTIGHHITYYFSDGGPFRETGVDFRGDIAFGAFGQQLVEVTAYRNAVADVEASAKQSR
jgi:hypothetical protein